MSHEMNDTIWCISYLKCREKVSLKLHKNKGKSF